MSQFDADKAETCKATGHSFPSGGTRRRPKPGRAVCSVCGTIRIVSEDGKKKFVRDERTEL